MYALLPAGQAARAGGSAYRGGALGALRLEGIRRGRRLAGAFRRHDGPAAQAASRPVDRNRGGGVLEQVQALGLAGHGPVEAEARDRGGGAARAHLLPARAGAGRAARARAGARHRDRRPRADPAAPHVPRVHVRARARRGQPGRGPDQPAPVGLRPSGDDDRGRLQDLHRRGVARAVLRRPPAAGRRPDGRRAERRSRSRTSSASSRPSSRTSCPTSSRS